MRHVHFLHEMCALKTFDTYLMQIKVSYKSVQIPKHTYFWHQMHALKAFGTILIPNAGYLQNMYKTQALDTFVGKKSNEGL